MIKVDLLEEVIAESGVTKTAIADKMGISRESLYNKLSGKTEFMASEISSISNAIHLTKEQRDDIFFAL